MHLSAMTKIVQRTESRMQSNGNLKKIASGLISIFKALNESQRSVWLVI
jgi:hypothetical protein